ncbi:alpha/beta hydrolase family esterase [Nonomuraea sp. NPDC003214]
MIARAAAVTALLATASCTAAPPPPPRADASPRTAPTRAETGCGERRLPGGRHTFEHGGLTRTFLLSVPAGRGPHPVLLNLHGLGSDARQQAAYTRLPREGAARGYIVATPQAADGRLAWTLPHTYGPDDTAFLGALLDHLEDGLCADRRRAFAAGLSYGGAMAVALVCGLRGRLAGAAAVGGVSLAPPCERPPPATVVAVHGTADRVVPYQGGHPLREATGDLRALADLVTLPPVPAVSRRWAAAYRCGPAAASSPASRVRLSAWTSCAGGAAVRLYTVKDGGHTWPGPVEVPRLGRTETGLDATRLLLDVFDRAPDRS